MTFLAHNICCFDRMDVFWNGRDSREFFMKRLNNMTLEHSSFERMAVFFDKICSINMGMRIECFSDVFKKYVHESVYFFIKNPEKRSLYGFFSP